MNTTTFSEIDNDLCAFREACLNANGYAASTSFLPNTFWTVSAPSVLGGFGQLPLHCAVIGRVSSDRAHLKTHGDFNPQTAYPSAACCSARMDFLLKKDTGIFADDFEVARRNFGLLQAQSSLTGNRHNFLDGDALHFCWNLWEKKRSSNRWNDQRTETYNVGAEFSSWWEETRDSHNIRLMPVFDMDGEQIIDPASWEHALVGSLVQVTFTLKHFFFGPFLHQPAHDVFKAEIQAIDILEKM